MLGLGSFSVAIILKFFIVSEPGSSALSFCSGHWKFCSQTSSELEDASFFFDHCHIHTGLPGGSDNKGSACSETQVGPLSQEDPLEKGRATHPSILARRISRTEAPGGATGHGVTKSWTGLSD